MSTEGRLFREAERAARSIVSVLQNRSSNGESMEREAPRQDVTPLRDGEFKVELAAVIPQLRAFARGLCGNRDAVHTERISQLGRMVSEVDVHEDDWEKHLIFRSG